MPPMAADVTALPMSEIRIAVGTRVTTRPRIKPDVRLARIRLPPWVFDGEALRLAICDTAPVTRLPDPGNLGTGNLGTSRMIIWWLLCLSLLSPDPHFTETA
jgi:hypothetical protein